MERLINANEIRDDEGLLIGRYVYLTPDLQPELDKFFDSFLKTYQEDNSFFLTLDLETTGLDPRNGKILLVSLSWNGKHALVFAPEFMEITKFKEVLNTIPLCNQNMKFDAGWLYHHYGIEPKICFDTMLAAQLGWPGVFPQGRFSLDNIAKNLLKGIKMNKEIREEFIGMTLEDGFTDEQIQYSAMDALITHRLVHPIMRRLTNKNLLKIWNEIELPLANFLYKIEYAGLYIDKPALEELYNQKLVKTEELKKDILALIDNDPSLAKYKGKFNPNAPQQIISILTDKGIKLPDASEETLLAAQSETQDHLLEMIIEFRKTKSLISKYLFKWLDTHINSKTGCIHSNMKQLGAETGRLASSNPNVMNLMKDLRPLIKARTGFRIITCDYSAFEIRAAAAATQEDSLVKAFTDRAELLPIIKGIAAKYNHIDADGFIKAVSKGKIKITDEYENSIIRQFEFTDVHRRNAAMMMDIDVSEVTDEVRSIGKCVSLDTFVHTDKGMMRLRDILPKKLKKDTFYPIEMNILSDTGFKASNKVYYNGKVKCLKFKTQAGRELICTPNHKLRTVKKGKYVWQEANKFKLEDSLLVKASGDFPEKKDKEKTNVVLDYIKFGKIQDGKILLLQESKFIPAKYNKKEGLFISEDEKLVSFLKKIGCERNEFSIYPVLDQIDIKHFLLNLIISKDRGILIQHSSSILLKEIQNLITRLGAMPRYYAGSIEGYPTLQFSAKDQRVILGESHDKSDLNTWKLHNTLEGHVKIFEKQEKYGVAVLDKLGKEKQTIEFLIDNNIRRDVITSITEVEAETGDLSVPENQTIVYNGIITHNTLSYASLYGAGAPRVQQALAKEGMYYNLSKCQDFLDTFFLKLPKVKAFLENTHKKVLDPGEISTIYGRKRFFKLPPKYMSRRYSSALEASKREAANFNFQGCNADATKLAMVDLYEYFESIPEPRPFIINVVHDEIVVECPEAIVDEVSKRMITIMEEAGRKATNYGIPIEVSCSIGETWSK